MLKTILSTSTALLLIGCGGGSSSDGGGDTEPADTTAPIVSIAGSQNVTIEQFAAYTEEGATAFDETDGDLTVLISGSVDSSTLNTYTVQYSATDASSNEGIAERYVTVVAPEDNDKTQIDVLALYSPDAGDIYGGDAETRISHLFAVSNEIHSASRAGVNLNLVGVQSYDLNETDRSDDVLVDSTNEAAIKDIRDNVQADEVTLYRPYIGDGMCGLAWVNTPLSENYAYAHVSIDCPSDTTAHEIGHNMGLGHSHRKEGEGIYSYSRGHGVDNLFATVMAYPSVFSTSTELVFSNPALECHGEPCGIEEGYEGEADAARTIRETKAAIAAFR